MTVYAFTAGTLTRRPSRASVTIDVTRRPSFYTSTRTPTTFISSFLPNNTNNSEFAVITFCGLFSQHLPSGSQVLITSSHMVLNKLLPDGSRLFFANL